MTFPGGRFTPKDEDERARYAVYVLHRRSAEAAGVRSCVTALPDGRGGQRAAVVAGDLNDEVQAATTQILLGAPAQRSARRDTGDRTQAAAPGCGTSPRTPEQQRYSRIYHRRRELIDHVFVSHALVDTVQTVTTGDGDAPSITDFPTGRGDFAGSDHRPVVAVLSI